MYYAFVCTICCILALLYQRLIFVFEFFIFLFALLHVTTDQLQQIIKKREIQECKGNQTLESEWFGITKLRFILKKYQGCKTKAVDQLTVKMKVKIIIKVKMKVINQ